MQVPSAVFVWMFVCVHPSQSCPRKSGEQHLSPVPDAHSDSNDAPCVTVYDVSPAAVLKRAASSTVPKEEKCMEYIAMALRRKIFLIDFMILDGGVR